MLIKISGATDEKLVRSFDNLRVNKVADLETILLRLYSRISDCELCTIVIPDICDILTWVLENGLSLTESISKLNGILENIYWFASNHKTFIICNSQYYDTPHFIRFTNHLEVKFLVSQSANTITKKVSKLILEEQKALVDVMNKLQELENFTFQFETFVGCNKSSRKLEEELSNSSIMNEELFNLSGTKLLHILHNAQEDIVKYHENFEIIKRQLEFKNSELDRVNQELNIQRKKCNNLERKNFSCKDKVLQLSILNLQDDIAVKLESIKSYEKNIRALNKRVLSLKEKTVEEKYVTEWLRASIKKFNSQRWNKSRAFRKKTKKSEELLLKTGMFDTNFYETKYPDVKDSSLSPCCHYLLFGAYEGRIPSPEFHPTNYLQVNCDVVADGIEPLLHYSIFGVHEKRKINKY